MKGELWAVAGEEEEEEDVGVVYPFPPLRPSFRPSADDGLR